MKKLMILGLMMFITLVFTGCEKGQEVETNKDINMKQAIETYGDNYSVVELSNTDFLIMWDNAKLIFNNNECVGYISLY